MFVERILVIMSSAIFLKASSQDSFDCPERHFPCPGEPSNGHCVHQRNWCDGFEDCPGGHDETVQACEPWKGGYEFFRGYLTSMQKEYLKATYTDIDSSSCDMTLPIGCDCSFRGHLKCSNINYIPSTFPLNITKLMMQQNMITRIKTASFQSLSSLELLFLSNDEITDIEQHAFMGLQSLNLLLIMGNNISHLRQDTLTGLPNLKLLILNENQMREFDVGVLDVLSELRFLSLDKNKLRFNDARCGTFPSSLYWLSMEDNEMEFIDDNLFCNLQELQFLSLRKNRIRFISSETFHHMPDLKELDLSENLLCKLLIDIFTQSYQMSTLLLEFNPLSNLSFLEYSNMTNLTELYLGGITSRSISSSTFAKFKILNKVSFSRYAYCHYVPHVRNCEPNTDGISSLRNLLEMRVLRVAIWPISLCTCFGNAFVLFGRIVVRVENRVHSLLIKNLAGADFTMGIYLLSVATHDLIYRDNYNVHANDWLHSWRCHITGAVAVISSEVSIFILTYISLERYLAIVYPYSTRRLSVKIAVISLIMLWVIGTLLAAAPLMFTEQFGRFYGTNGVCFPLHLRDPYGDGWEYSATIFLGVNSLMVITMIFSYTSMLISVLHTSKWHVVPGNVPIAEELKFVRRFFAIVFTDGCCWLPVIIIKLLAFTNIQLSDDAYAWLIVFVLPINSALNPILYTLTTLSFTTSFKHLTTRRTSGFGFFSLFSRLNRRPSSISQKSAVIVLTSDVPGTSQSNLDPPAQYLADLAITPSVKLEDSERGILLLSTVENGSTPCMILED